MLHGPPHCRLLPRVVLWGSLGALCSLGTSVAANEPGKLIAAKDVARLGLHRAWFTQVRIDPRRSRVIRVVAHTDALVILTDQGTVQVLDGETGRLRWSTVVGNPDYPSAGPAVSDHHVAILNGSSLHLLSRRDGHELWKIMIRGAPGAAPVVTNNYVFVPMLSGIMEGHEIEQTSTRPWRYTSAGRIYVNPATSGLSIAWATERGYLYASRTEEPEVRFRLESGGQISHPPAAAEDYFYPVTDDGFIYAVHHINGTTPWHASIGDPVAVPPAAIANKLFVCSTVPQMHALDTTEGRELWQARGVQSFLAASPARVYGMGRFAEVHVLDSGTGVEVGRLKAQGSTIPVVNTASDRIYLVSPLGLVQCLHEVDQTEPIYYGQSDPQAEAGEGDGAADQPPAGTPGPAEPADDNPFQTP